VWYRWRCSLGLVVAHGAYFGPKIAEFAAESAEEAKSFAGKRRVLGKIYLCISYVNLLVSGVIFLLPVNIWRGARIRTSSRSVTLIRRGTARLSGEQPEGDCEGRLPDAAILRPSRGGANAPPGGRRGVYSLTRFLWENSRKLCRPPLCLAFIVARSNVVRWKLSVLAG